MMCKQIRFMFYIPQGCVKKSAKTQPKKSEYAARKGINEINQINLERNSHRYKIHNNFSDLPNLIRRRWVMFLIICQELTGFPFLASAAGCRQ